MRVGQYIWLVRPECLVSRSMLTYLITIKLMLWVDDIWKEESAQLLFVKSLISTRFCTWLAFSSFIALKLDCYYRTIITYKDQINIILWHIRLILGNSLGYSYTLLMLVSITNIYLLLAVWRTLRIHQMLIGFRT